jgi:hypothetical protein
VHLNASLFFLDTDKCLYLCIIQAVDSHHLCFFAFTQLLRNKLVSTARKSMGKNSNLGQLYQSMQEAYNEIQTPLVYQLPSALVD